VKKHQASSTAFTVLQGVVYIAGHPQHADLVSDEMQEASVQILSDSQEGRKRLGQLNSWFFRPLIPLLEKLMMPGITLHYVLRKRFIENYVLKSIQEGATQVINLGAGFDTVAFRLSKQYPNVNFIEVDHPATHEVKQQALQGSATKSKNLHFVPVDFTTQRLEDVLKHSPLVQPNSPTLIIVEGVLMYLTKPQVQHLFESLSLFLHAGRRVIFTAVKPAAQSSNSYGPLLKVYLKIKKEPLKWTCEKEKLEEFLQAVHYDLRQLAGAQEFKNHFLPSDYKGFIHDGEYIAVSEQGWHSSN